MNIFDFRIRRGGDWASLSVAAENQEAAEALLRENLDLEGYEVSPMEDRKFHIAQTDGNVLVVAKR